jgi:exodeoxyribonuclease VII large subunit
MAPARLAERLRGRRIHLDALGARAAAAAATRRRQAADRAAALAARLQGLSPLAVLGRGYAICYDAAGAGILKDARAVSPGDGVRVRLDRGRLVCDVKEVLDGTRDETN